MADGSAPKRRAPHTTSCVDMGHGPSRPQPACWQRAESNRYLDPWSLHMPTLHTLKLTLPLGALAVTRPRLLMTILVLSIASVTACSDRALPEGGAGTAPPATVTDHQDAHAEGEGDTAAPQDAHASHPPAGTSSPILPATPWASDAPLREGMRRMHRAVEALGHAEHDHLDAAQATAAAHQVQAAAEYMIAHCKLAPEPDAALHGLLATLLRGAAAIKADPANTTPVAAMRDAMALYPRMFQDVAWQADTSGVK